MCHCVCVGGGGDMCTLFEFIPGGIYSVITNGIYVINP